MTAPSFYLTPPEQTQLYLTHKAQTLQAEVMQRDVYGEDAGTQTRPEYVCL